MSRSADSNETADLALVRAALRAELVSRGHAVSSDTLGMRREIYIIGENDLARALFHFDTDAADAAETLYRSSGSWSAGMPPRFAVLPESESTSPSLEMLEQMRTTPVFFSLDGGTVTFHDLDRLLAEQLGA